MKIIPIKETINQQNSNRTFSYTVNVAPGFYDINLFVWADGSLGKSVLSANDEKTVIKSNGAVQIDGLKTLDEIILNRVTVEADGILNVNVIIDSVDSKLSGVIENLVVKESVIVTKENREYITMTQNEPVTNLENGYYTLTVLTKYRGGDDLCYLYADTGALKTTAAIPRNNFPYESGDDWKKVTLRGIHVTNGILTVGVATDCGALADCLTEDFKLEKTDQPFEFLNGGDITELTYTEDMGGKYFDFEGNERDPLELLKESGWNLVRIRIYNHPGKGRGDGTYYVPDHYQDTADALKLAKRAKALDLKIQLSFHYSDTWTNPGQQMIPHDWQKLIVHKSEVETVAILKDEIYKFTKEVLRQMNEQGTTPDIISVGNETRNGMLFPYGSTENWDNLAEFYNAGTQAIREETPNSIAMIHLDDGGNLNTYVDHFGNARQRNVDFDMIGTSFYPYWTQKTATKFATFANDVAREFNKPLMCMETAFNFTANTGSGRVGQLTNNGPYGDKESSTPELQRDFMIEFLNEIQGVENGMCVGSVYWDPIMIYANGKTGWAYFEETDQADINVIDNTTLFDFQGRALPVLNTYKYHKRR